MRIHLITGFVIIGIALIEIGCEGLERSNPLDPNNPMSERRRVVLVEAFVNDSTPYSPFALAALDDLASQTTEAQTLFLVYHLPSQSYPDTNAISSGRVRYDFYTTQNQAVPDVFFNGLRHRVQGAASKNTALKRYQNVFTQERDEISHFTIEAQTQVSGNTLSVNVSIARLGDDELTDFFLQAVAFEDISAPGHHYVVRQVLPSESITRVASSERKDITLTASIQGDGNPQRWQVVVFIQQNSKKEVLQAVLANRVME